jgi:hypothetical protein
MSVALAMNVHDGIILAADSASTLTLGPTPTSQPGVRPSQIANVYNNANKIANLWKGRPIGCVAFGSGSIGSVSISTLLKDFRQKLHKPEAFEIEDSTFNIDDFTMEGVAKLLASFLSRECQKLPESTPPPTLGIFLAGYSTGAALGERWAINIQSGQAPPPVRLHAPDQVGMNWGGEGGEAISRVVLGYSNRLLNVLGRAVPAQLTELMPMLGQLQAPVVFAPMPIQDAIDLAEFLVHTAIQYSRFVPGAQVVGGPIEIAAITKHEGFKWIRRKHYYSAELNRETNGNNT